MPLLSSSSLNSRNSADTYDVAIIGGGPDGAVIAGGSLMRYDPSFSFVEFSRRFPQHRPALIDCLVGDVVEKDMSAFLDAFSRMTAGECRDLIGAGSDDPG